MPISSLSLRSGSMARLAALSFLATGAVAVQSGVYKLQTKYDLDTFFDNFDFYTGPDPNNGFVVYEDYDTALDDGLISSDTFYNYMGVDSTYGLQPDAKGRSATKLISKQTYNHGLFVVEINNMPGGICGTVPGFYLGGGLGEISVVSGTNDNPFNTMSMFTSGPYEVSGNGGTGVQQSTSCQSGCTTTDNYHGQNISYGSNFNEGFGGVFATQWDSDGVKIWFWAMADIPGNLWGPTADPNTWGKPVASLTGSSVDGLLLNGKIVFDTNFCGTLVESFWTQSKCYDPNTAPTCAQYVASNPEDFESAYWGVGNFRVYQRVDDPLATAGPIPLSQSTTSSSAVATSTSQALPSSSGNPSACLAWESMGCWSSNDGFSSFWPVVNNSQANSVAFCTATCDKESALYAAMHDGDCYCGDRNMVSATTQLGADKCRIMCQGEITESCGGDSFLPKRESDKSKRLVPAGTLFNIYAKKPCGSSTTSTPLPTTSTNSDISSTETLPTSLSSANPSGVGSSDSATLTAGTSTMANSSITADAGASGKTSSPTSNMSNSLTTALSSVSTGSWNINPSPIIPVPLVSALTLYTTNVYTILSCPPTVTHCPVGSLGTKTIAVTTDVPATSAPNQGMLTRVIYATSVYTITSCPPKVINCPASLGKLTTETISSYTAFFAPPAVTQPPIYHAPGAANGFVTTVISTSYVDVCPTGLTTIAISETRTIVAGAPNQIIPMVQSTATVTLAGSVQTLTLTVPFSATPFIATASGQKGNVATLAAVQNTPGAGNPGVVVVTSTYVVMPVASKSFSPSGNRTAGIPGPAKTPIIYQANEGMGRSEWSSAAVAVLLVATFIVL